MKLSVGNAIQLGFAALGGNPFPYEPDWIVDECVDRGPGEYYRYHVMGRNLNYGENDPDHRFSWSVPTLCWRFAFTADSVFKV